VAIGHFLVESRPVVAIQDELPEGVRGVLESLVARGLLVLRQARAIAS